MGGGSSPLCQQGLPGAIPCRIELLIKNPVHVSKVQGYFLFSLQI